MHEESTAIAKTAEFATKVVETVAPFLAPLQARAEVRAEKIRARGRNEVAEIEDKGLEERAMRRLQVTEARRQRNIEQVCEQARALPPGGGIAADPVDEDWVASFLGHCSDVSNERMQTVWARILAGEVAKPGSFSLLTLSTIRLLSFKDAELFTRFCSYVWQTPDGPVPVYIDDMLPGSGTSGLGMPDLMNLRSLNLITYESSSIWEWNSRAESTEVSYYGRRYKLRSPGKHVELTTEVFLTGVGAQLFPIAGGEPDERYRAQVVTSWAGGQLEVEEVTENARDAEAPIERQAGGQVIAVALRVPVRSSR